MGEDGNGEGGSDASLHIMTKSVDEIHREQSIGCTLQRPAELTSPIGNEE